ncbi:hypothetical protein HPB49_005176 [Dermacentor silvarum]|uniref:Uncharacterized protein n=1 Tax=Dermacentor silvarum TaxID=543639 RepID=A0ACB8D360_DERSI|nr:hypothetical protein HPB49_005176 [Dermacentor silvarum]
MDASEDISSSDPCASGILRSRNTTAAYTACGRLLRSRPAHTPSAIVKRVRNARTTTSGRGRAPPRRLLTPSPEEHSPAIQQGSTQPSATENAVPSPPSETISSVSLSAPAVQEEPPVVRFYFLSPVAASQLATTTLPATPQVPPSVPADCDENEAPSDEGHETSPVCSSSNSSSSPGSSFYEQTTPQPSPLAVSTESSSQTDSDETTSSSHSDDTASPPAPSACTGYTPAHAVGSPDNSRSAPPDTASSAAEGAVAIASAAETDVTAPTQQQAAVSSDPRPCNQDSSPPRLCTPSVPSTPPRLSLSTAVPSATDRASPPASSEETFDLARVRDSECARKAGSTSPRHSQQHGASSASSHAAPTRSDAVMTDSAHARGSPQGRVENFSPPRISPAGAKQNIPNAGPLPSQKAPASSLHECNKPRTQSCALGPIRPLIEDAFSQTDYAHVTPWQSAKTSQRVSPPAHDTTTCPPASSLPTVDSNQTTVKEVTPPNQELTRAPRQRRRRYQPLQREQPRPQHVAHSNPPETILFRPKSRTANFMSATKDAIAAQLSKVPGAKRVRINLRGNVVAVDCEPSADSSPLLAVSTICGVEVKAKAANNKNVCTGVVFGVDPTFDCDTLAQNIESSAPIVACARSGRNLVVKFAGSTAPSEVALFKQQRPVRPRRPRPLQCTNCGRYGHVAPTCTGQSRCLRCGGSHSMAECTAPHPKCINCNGRHIATEPRCPRWQQERKVAEIMAAAPQPISRREAVSAAKKLSSYAASKTQSEARPSAHVQPGRTFSQALTGQPALTPPPQPQNDNSDSQKDVVIAALAAAVKALLGTLQHDSPVHQLCTAALAAHEALTHHG